MKKESGQITVFFSLVLLLLVSLVFTLLESARSEGIALRVKTAANSCIESVFAQYDRVLWNEYGLLFFADRYGDAAEVSEEAKKYAERNSGEDWLMFNAESVELQKYVLATDAQGAVFEQAVADYMRGSGLAEAALSMGEEAAGAIEEMNISEEGSSEFDFSDIQSRIDDLQEKMNEAEESEEESEEDGEEQEPDDEGYGNAGRVKAMEIFLSLKDTFGSFRKKGLLMLVCEDVSSISDRPYDKKDFPSGISSEAKKRSASMIEEPSLIDDILMKEYFLRKFSSYTDGDREFMELEYIICGKDSALSNLYSVVKRLVALRFALNYLTIHNDKEKCDIAKLIGTVLVGWTGMEALVEAVKEVVLLIWALVESVSDVKALLNGEKVPPFKKGNSWSVSIDEAAAGNVSGKGKGEGWNYEQYLRILVYLTGCEKSAYRAMDLIQKKTKEKEPSFLMKNCVYGTKIRLSGTSEAFFPYLPGTVDYRFSAETAYSYGKVAF